MYIPSANNEPDLNTQHNFIERHSFGLLVSEVDDQPFATHLPFLLERNSGSKGTLIGHTARANPQCATAGQQTVLAIFSGPHAYISPTWYEVKDVVPTWNYVAVHVTGRIQLIEDKHALLDLVARTTVQYEQKMPSPWIFDGSTTFADRLASQIIGFRIEIESIEGKWKLNQNHPLERQQKVVRALREQGDENSLGVATLMSERLTRVDEGPR